MKNLMNILKQRMNMRRVWIRLLIWKKKWKIKKKLFQFRTNNQKNQKKKWKKNKDNQKIIK